MYDKDEPLSIYGLNLYLSSAHSNDVKFCMIPSVTKMDPSTWPNMRSELLSYFQLPNYQKVQGNRPLLFLLVPSQTNSPGGFATWADAKAAFDELRTATIAAGLGPFYGVVMRADPTAGQNIM